MVSPLDVAPPSDLPKPVMGLRPTKGTAWPAARRQAEAIRHAVAQSLLAVARSSVSVSEEARAEVLLRHVEAWVALDSRLRTKGRGHPPGPSHPARKSKPKPITPETMDLLERIAAQQAAQSKEPSTPPEPTQSSAT